MISAGAGLSTLPDSRQAAMEACRKALRPLEGRRPDFCVAFISGEHGPALDEVLEVLSRATGTPYVVGCSAAGILAEGREVERGPAMGVMAVASDKIRATGFLFHDDGDHGLTAGLRLGQRFLTSRNSGDLVLVWSDPHTIRPDLLLQGLDATIGSVPVAGAASSARTMSDGTFQFHGVETGRKSVSGIRLGGEFRYHVAITQGCRSLGEPLTVTRSHENFILEVGGRPAMDVLRDVSPTSLLQDPARALQSLVVGLVPESGSGGVGGCDYLVRNIVAADPDTGALAIADTLEEGQQIVFALREARSAREDVARMLRQILATAGDLSFRFGLYFNCLARGESLYQQNGVDAGFLENALPGVPLLGLFGNAEIAPVGGVNQVLTYTGVLVLFAD